MRILKIKITIENIHKDLEISPESINEIIELQRNEDKLWYVESNYSSRRGLFPFEIRLANEIQEKILHPFNGGK